MRQWLLVFLVLLVGCGKPPEPATAKGEPSDASATPAAPEDRQREQLLAGSFQIEAALDAVESAVKRLTDAKAKEKGDVAAALDELADMLDSTGTSLVEAQVPNPNDETAPQEFAARDEARLKSIEAANDVLAELRDAQGLAESLVESRPQSEPIRVMAEDLTEAIDAVTQAIEELGGQVKQPVEDA